MTIRHDAQITLTCQIETPGVLLGLVVAYPCGFLIQMIFFSFLDPVGFIWTVVFQKCLVMFL